MTSILPMLLALVALLLVIGCSARKATEAAAPQEEVATGAPSDPQQEASDAPLHEKWEVPLQAALQGADRLRVRSGGTCHRQKDDEETLLDLKDAPALAELVKGIRIIPWDSASHCMCCGDPTLEFYRGDTLVASLGFHHARSLRWLGGTWIGDGPLTEESANFLVTWLADHGVTGPQDDLAESRQRYAQAKASQERWLTAMPDSLDPFERAILDLFGSEPSPEMQAALTKEFPEPKDRILALLTWFGSGDGPWSGFPSYESTAEDFLLLHTTQAILAAVQDTPLTDPQTEGLARLLGGWSFSRQRPQDLRLVPTELKARLLAHSLQSDDEDKRGRAQRAFGVPAKDAPAVAP